MTNQPMDSSSHSIDQVAAVVMAMRAKMRSAASQVVARTVAARLGQITITEYPKSGGTWVTQLLGGALSLPDNRHRLPPLRKAMLHGHFLSPIGLRRVVVVWRDGRDVLVSWYHHCFHPHNPESVALSRRVVRETGINDPRDIRANLPRFIEWSFTRQRSPPFSWSRFADVWHGEQDAIHTSYEALQRDTFSEIVRLCTALGQDVPPAEKITEVISRFSFKRQTDGRQPGQESPSSFLRKGIVGDWRNVFSPESRRIFDYHAGKQLISLGYEPDTAWVTAESGDFRL